ncbi:MAG: hypothetical protein Q7T56_02745 [Nocardioidaceae bacterium]|nr:hypothetical protein [Nocardioidaceae bacterium]
MTQRDEDARVPTRGQDPRAGGGGGGGAEDETFNPWSIVHLVFEHLVDEGLHPVLGETGDPGEPAAALLRAMGVVPDAQGNREIKRDIQAHLETLRTTVLGER